MTQEPDVLSEVVEILGEVLGADFLLEGEVTRKTSFSQELALESIEFVVLAEKIQRRFGAEVDFAAFLAGMGIEELMTMTVGQLVDHIESRLRPAAV
jgi:acyl carrier protein